jgi:DNA-directed RNA polymerase specialized sigma24 family protein
LKSAPQRKLSCFLFQNAAIKNAMQPSGNPGQWFASTHWSLILAVGSSTASSRAALETLCRGYWRPLYLIVLRKGFDAQSAQDLTQEFFAALLARNDLAAMDPGRGRFRSFLLGALDNFLANEWRKRGTLKRGGNVDFISIHETDSAGRLACDPATELTPEKLYERRWAMTLMERALDRLRAEAAAAGKSDLFDALSEFLAEPPAQGDYPPLAQKLNITESALRVAVHRLRQRYRTLLRDEIAQTVESPAAVDSEIRELFLALS